MRVYELMRTGFLTVEKDLPVEACRERFAAHHVSSAPVVERGDELVGFVTCRDLYWGWQMPGKAGRTAVVADVMTAPAVGVPEGADVRAAAALLSRLRLDAVPVTRDGRLVGLLSSGDLCTAVARGQLRDVLDLALGPQPGDRGTRIWLTPRSA